MWYFFVGIMIGAIGVKSVRSYNYRYYESFYIFQENEIKKLKNLLLDKKLEDGASRIGEQPEYKCNCNKSC